MVDYHSKSIEEHFLTGNFVEMYVKQEVKRVITKFLVQTADDIEEQKEVRY